MKSICIIAYLFYFFGEKKLYFFKNKHLFFGLNILNLKLYFTEILLK